MNDTPAIAVEHLSLRYGGVTALDDVSFAVEPGSVVGLLGRNGAGKTTLLNCILGLTAPQDGAARILNCASLNLTDSVRERLGYVPQTPELFDWLTVQQNLELIGRFYKNWSDEYASALCARMSLSSHANARTLSPGERQRLAIVQALAHKPDLLIFDEPVASLDPIARRDFLRTLFDHTVEAGRDVTVVLSSHLLEDIERVATHLLFLRNGAVQCFANHDEVSENFQVVYSAYRLDRRTRALHTGEVANGQWRSVVDVRTFDRSALHSDAKMSRVALGDLFEAFNT